MYMIKETDIAWLAGLLDGEGCLTYFRQKRSGAVNQLVWHLNMAMTDREVVEEAARILRDLSGDRVNVRSRNPLSGFSKRTQYVIDVSTKGGILRALHALEPFFRRLKLQALLVMDVLERATRVKRYSATRLDYLIVDILKRLKRGCKEARAEAEDVLAARRQVTLSQAGLGLVPMTSDRPEGAETTGLTPKNNSPQERPAPHLVSNERVKK